MTQPHPPCPWRRTDRLPVPIALTTPPPSAFRPAAGVLSFQIGAIGLAVALGLAAQATGGPNTPGLIAVIATATFLLGGLPHGAFDLHLAARSARLGGTRFAIFAAIYIGLVVLMLIGWALVPGVILPLFLASAAVHFGGDWPETDEPLFRTALGCAPICAIGIGHLGEVEAIFAAMATPAIAVWASDLFILVAPVALLVAATALVVMARRGAWQRPAVFAAMLASLVILPPLIGFALFFCAFHTPQHLIALREELSHWRMMRVIAVGSGMTAVALVLGIVALPLMVSGGELMAAGGFQLLAALAMPHQSMKFIMARFA